MRNFLAGEAYYLRKDITFKGICVIFLMVSLVLLVWVGQGAGFDVSSAVQPLSMISPLSLFLYFVIPVHACYFSTEGFEYGSVKNIIASGQSRSSYILGKYVTLLKVILWCVFQFFGLFYVLHMAAALVTGADMANNSLRKDAITAVTAIGFNLLYLSAYSAIVMMVGMLVRKTASAILITFVTIFGDFLVTGYLKESSYAWLRTVSDNTLMTQILKFSGLNVVHSQQILLSGIREYLHMALIPLVIIAVCLSIAGLAFTKRDIHT